MVMFSGVIVIRRFRSLNIPEYTLINCNGYYNGTFLLLLFWRKKIAKA